MIKDKYIDENKVFTTVFVFFQQKDPSIKVPETMQLLGIAKDAENKTPSKTQTTLAVNARKISRLEKRSRHLAVWRERWCLLLEPSKFYTYKSNDFSQKPTEVIDLEKFYVQEDSLSANHFRLFRKHKLKKDANDTKNDGMFLLKTAEEKNKKDPHHFHFRGDLKDVLEWITIIRELESIRYSAIAPYINCALNARAKQPSVTKSTESNQNTNTNASNGSTQEGTESQEKQNHLDNNTLKAESNTTKLIKKLTLSNRNLHVNDTAVSRNTADSIADVGIPNVDEVE
ncbi:hypothetical protein RFI_27147 [Reticulomyxa filosa]|uniref:PH domain-containing protein n=1 Tax=Reticulomyxa filosa TaxID=46433 RepID=X6M8I6_RETFI|nr:hypothetical protein RFI_27147 [Reticulomyxa filosa]|eukprot:ETO10229.1 hypothetical protein RFI_27147 [Reticulomyxa filosa]